MIQERTRRPCKLCTGQSEHLYVIQGIPYYSCPRCDFLQNFYWEDHEHGERAQVVTNEEARARLWQAGDPKQMREKGWEMLGLMTSPVAWTSRTVHTLLKRVPAYEEWTKRRAKTRLRRLLDFGCGHGVIVRELRKEGVEIIGVDPFSPTSHPSILRTSLPEAHIPAGTFDGIFTIEVMEHIPNVLETFVELRRILRPGGVLLVQTRRLEDPEYVRERDHWFYLQEPQTHVSIYSVTAMRRIAERAGFRSVAFRGVKLARFLK